MILIIILLVVVTEPASQVETVAGTGPPVDQDALYRAELRGV